MSYALTTLWHERQRYLPAMLAVAFSAVLVALQIGLLLGTFSTVSIPIDHTDAHLWVGSCRLESLDVCEPVPEAWVDRLRSLPEVVHAEPYVQDFARWRKPQGGTSLSIVIGARLRDDALGAVRQLTPDLRRLLTCPGNVVVDEADLKRLGLRRGVGETAEVNGRRVRVVGLVHGLKGLAGPYVFCSLETARNLLGMPADRASYFLARCRHAAEAPAVAARLGQYAHEMAAFPSADFSFQSQRHWVWETGGGIALGFAALLGLLVGAAVTKQTLSAAVVASLREYAVLRAMGLPRRRIAALVLTQSFWIGLVGLVVAAPAVFGLARLAVALQAQVHLPLWLLAASSTVTLATALPAGMLALRSLRLVEPATLLR